MTSPITSTATAQVSPGSPNPVKPAHDSAAAAFAIVATVIQPR
jgi:hypothetical protein